MPGRDTVPFKERGCHSTPVLRGQLGQASLWSKRGKESSWNIPVTVMVRNILGQAGTPKASRNIEGITRGDLFSRQEHLHSEKFKDKVRNIWVFLC